MILSKNVLLNLYSSIKTKQKDLDDFWHRKLTLKVKFWYFLTAPHYSNFQNLVISFEYSWFLAKNLSNFVSLPWKLHNRKCHNVQSAWFKIWKKEYWNNQHFFLVYIQNFAHYSRIKVLVVTGKKMLVVIRDSFYG